MEFRKKTISLNEAKEMNMVTYLSSLGHTSSKIRNHDFLYMSPLRDEKTASFKIDRRLNKWYDHGIGKGDNLVDFAILYHDCTIGELLQQFNGLISFHGPLLHQATLIPKAETKNLIVGDHMLSSYALLSYLNQRRIPIEIAILYCREMRDKLNEKNYYGIGFKNDTEGWEIRNPYFKTSSSPKDIDFINGGAGEVFVFEGIMDVLSFKFLHKNLPENSQDFVVLNSISFLERARQFMEAYSSIRLYPDRDVAEKNCTQRALSLSSKYRDDSSLYQRSKDQNDWLENFRNDSTWLSVP